MREEKRLRIKNLARRNRPGRLDWTVWIDGPTEKLDEIDQVEYILHPTFPQPVRTVRERSTNFRLDSRGWGEFMIHAKITTKNGQVLDLDHWLRLRETTGGGSTQLSIKGLTPDLNEVYSEKLTVFVSYSRADLPVFKVFRTVLKDHGLEVVTADASRVSQPLEREIKSLIGSADAVVALISEEPSRWVVDEIAEAQRQGVTVVPVLLGDAEAPTSLADLQSLRISNPNDPEEVIGVLEDQLAKLLPQGFD
jgi:transcription initiation factor IIF auxiliary subunit